MSATRPDPVASNASSGRGRPKGSKTPKLVIRTVPGRPVIDWSDEQRRDLELWATKRHTTAEALIKANFDEFATSIARKVEIYERQLASFDDQTVAEIERMEP